MQAPRTSILWSLLFLLTIGLVGLHLPGCTSNTTPQETSSDAGATDNSAADTPSPTTIRALSANVGNSDLANCKKYGIKLCREIVLQALKASIARIKPHLIALQEVLAPTQCEGVQEDDTAMICHHVNKESIPPIRRLLGPDYTIACEGRKQYECIAVLRSAGSIQGCEDGKLCTNAQSVTPEQSCNQAFTVSAVDLTLAGVSLRVVNVHPDSKDRACRRKHIAAIFEEAPKLAEAPRVLLMGDLNLDPHRTNPADDESVALWQKYVGLSKPFAYHSGPAEHDPPYPTDLLGRTIDHVASNFAKGTCQTLGATPNTERLDGTPETALARLDHLTLLCTLELQPKP